MVHVASEDAQSPSGQLPSVPTTLEIMAKVTYEAGGLRKWEEVKDKRFIVMAMRASLFALAEAELDVEMINAGWGEDEHAAERFDDNFRALIREIASQ